MMNPAWLSRISSGHRSVPSFPSSLRASLVPSIRLPSPPDLLPTCRILRATLCRLLAKKKRGDHGESSPDSREGTRIHVVEGPGSEPAEADVQDGNGITVGSNGTADGGRPWRKCLVHDAQSGSTGTSGPRWGVDTGKNAVCPDARVQIGSGVQPCAGIPVLPVS